MNPPEMNTSQLLLVSTLGLGVNLFGMFAMGGHHHHVSSSRYECATLLTLLHRVAIRILTGIHMVMTLLHLK